MKNISKAAKNNELACMEQGFSDNNVSCETPLFKQTVVEEITNELIKEIIKYTNNEKKEYSETEIFKRYQTIISNLHGMFELLIRMNKIEDVRTINKCHKIINKIYWAAAK